MSDAPEPAEPPPAPTASAPTAAPVAAEPPVAARPAEPAAVTAAAEPDAAADLGREYVERDDSDREDVAAVIDEVDKDRYGRLIFRFSNGQVWRQMEARRFQYPKDGPFEVVIGRGMLGDYQLRVEGKGRMTRIVRIQ